MDRRSDRAIEGCFGFPRTRGDGPIITTAGNLIAEFPPHARGWTGFPCQVDYLYAVSPARAGMDLCTGRERSSGARFPRTRGDGPCIALAVFRVILFPPHARGWTRYALDAGRRDIVSPARAGMDR